MSINPSSEPATATSVAAPTPGAPEPDRVRSMFDRVAGRYDLLNHVLSFQLDRRWRRLAARRATRDLERPRVLDLCTGTGDLLLALRRSCPGAALVGGDFSLSMLALAARKDPGLRLVGVDALRLPFGSRSFDVVTAAFGVRNFTDRSAGLREMARVLAPGGRLVILEFSPPPPGLFGRIYQGYSRHLLPRIAGLLAGDRSAYRYLPASVDSFPPPEELSAELQQLGFSAVRFDRLAFGTVALHCAQRESQASDVGAHHP